MQGTLTSHTRRFFIGTYNPILVLIIAILACRVLTNSALYFSAFGVIIGALAYMFSEAFAHRYMHQPGTIFYRSHTAHHAKKTPESGLPERWLYFAYLGIAIFLVSFNLPILQGVYLGLMVYLTTYEYIHFLCHCNYKPKTRLGWRIRVNHLKHHNHDEQQHFELMFLRKKSG